jgi:hypothetical protein
MDSDPAEDRSANNSPQWPTAPMLMYGTFGTRSPAGRRYHFRSGLALAAMVVCMLSGVLLSAPVLTALAPGAAFVYIVWEFRKYLSALDELARRIQLESIAWTYLSGLAVAMLLGGLGLVYGWLPNPLWFIVLEPVRAGWLYFVSRRYS